MVDITTAQPDLNPHCPRRVGPRVPLMYNERMQDASIQLYTLHLQLATYSCSDTFSFLYFYVTAGARTGPPRGRARGARSTACAMRCLSLSEPCLSE